MTASDTPLQRFASLARVFCAWCEDESVHDRSETIVATWLARLHTSALELGHDDPQFDGDWPELPEGELERVRRNLQAFIGDYYRVVFDPDPTLDEAPVVGDVGDDLLDTYSDVKKGLLAFGAKGNEAARWYWSYMHRLHWGKHVVGALSALNGKAMKLND